MQDKKFIKSWIILAVLALGIAGLFSILLVLLRSPYLQEFLPKNLFKQALIVHVNLSVLFWISSAITISFLETISIKYYLMIRMLTKCAFLSIIIITFSAFIPRSVHIMCNYIPILHNLPFFVGLSLFLTVIFILSVSVIGSVQYKNLIKINGQEELIPNFTIALSVIISFIGFIVSAKYMKNYLEYHSIPKEEFYELIFWGGGHLLQFSFIQIMCFSWLQLMTQLIGKKDYKIFNILLLINVILQLAGVTGYRFAIEEPGHLLFFTWHMKYFAGIVPTIYGLIIIILLYKFNKVFNFKFMLLLSSILLFMAGGIISLKIKGSNVIIPAHYHGSIVGISISLMGLIILKIEQYKLGIINKKLAYIQPLCYSVGQFLHIVGLAWSGGYGILRKNPGEVLNTKAKIAMSLMSGGGLVAIIGGFLFVYICYKSLFSDKKLKIL